MEPLLEEKQHILELVQEMKKYVEELPVLMRLPQHERTKIADRMIAIKNEMKAFRERYPNA